MALLWVVVIILAIFVVSQQKRLNQLQTRLNRLDPATPAERPAPIAEPIAQPVPEPKATAAWGGGKAEAAAPPATPANETLSSPPPPSWGRDGEGALLPEPTPAPTPQTKPEPAKPTGPSLGDRLTLWLRDNWLLAIAAASLALAGIFFVQYGVERGLLPPPVRVLAALAFGLALVFAGERLRLRHGDDQGPWRAIPSTLSSAGIVSLFAAILAARHLYDLIGSGLTFAGLLATSALALTLGWRHTPFLGAAGLIGAAVTPLILNGNSDNADPLYVYYALIAATGLAIDTLRRWAWMSVLALVLATLGGLAIHSAGAASLGLALLLLALTVLAVAIPDRALVPQTQGPGLLDALEQRQVPAFPVQLALGMAATAALILARARAYFSSMTPRHAVSSAGVGIGFGSPLNPITWLAAARSNS